MSPALADFSLTWLERMPHRWPAADLTPWPPAPRPEHPDLARLGADRRDEGAQPEAPEVSHLRVQADIAPADSPLGWSPSASVTRTP